MNYFKLLFTLLFCLVITLCNAQISPILKLRNLEGEAITLKDYLNPNSEELTVITFWAS